MLENNNDAMLQNSDEESYDSWDQGRQYTTLSYPKQSIETPKAPMLRMQRIFDSECELSLDLSFENNDQNLEDNEGCNFNRDLEESSEEDYNDDDAVCSNIFAQSGNQNTKDLLRKIILREKSEHKKTPKRVYTYIKAESLGPKFLQQNQFALI